MPRLDYVNCTFIFTDGPDRPPQVYPPSAVSTPTVGRDCVERIEHPGVSALKKPYMKQVTTPGITDTPISSQSRYSKHYKTVVLKRSNSIELGSSQVNNTYIPRTSTTKEI